jgi:hypothetical protein
VNEPIKGYYYEVTAEQVKKHKRLSVKEILQWLEQTNAFVNKVRTDKAKKIAEQLRSGK